MTIHPTAIIETIHPIDKSVEIGAYCTIGKNVKLGKNTRLESHIAISGNTVIGENCHIFPFASIGHVPQDLKFKGEDVRLEIGNNNTIREHVTINPGTEGGGSLTKIGDDCLFMVASHIAHDCVVGNHVILANNATLAGHVHVDDFAIIGGLSAIHQFVRIGKHAMIGGMSGIESDVIPFGSAMGERASLAGLNLLGLKRRGFNRDEIHTLRTAYRLLFATEGTLEERIEDTIEQFGDIEVVRDVINFIRSEGSRALCQPKENKNG